MLFVCIIIEFLEMTFGVALDESQNACVRMPTSAACRLPRVRRRPCVFKNCQSGESKKNSGSTSLEYRNFIPSNKRQLIFRNLIFQAPVFCQTAKKTRWITKFCCSEARKPTATSCQVQRLTFAMQFWAQLLRLNFFSSFTSARLSLQTGFGEKPMTKY